MREEVINYEVSNCAQGWYSYILYLFKITPGAGKVDISAQSHSPGQKSKSVSHAVSLSLHTQTHARTRTHTHTHTHTCTRTCTHIHAHTCTHADTCAHMHDTHTHMHTHTGQQGGVSHSRQMRTQKPPHSESSLSAGVSLALQHRPRHHSCQVQQLIGLVAGSTRPQVGPDSGPIRCRDTKESRSGS